MRIAWSVIKGFAANPKFIGGKTGMIAILYTWGQNVSFHPHLHCVVCVIFLILQLILYLCIKFHVLLSEMKELQYVLILLDIEKLPSFQLC